MSDDRYLTGSNDSRIRLWNQGRCETVLSGHRDWVRSLALTHSDEWLLSGSMDGVVKLWDVGRVTVAREFLVVGTTHMNSIQSIVFSSNETCFFTVTREGALCGYDLRTSESLFTSVTPI